ncbi:MAG: hypothetical protein EBU90_14620 [Proteobacteria bacterium]|nr:hypothetical protein [Pseudomonadota bacterium]NBP15687.1 hypothetical protein [bacterium]
MEFKTMVPVTVSLESLREMGYDVDFVNTFEVPVKWKAEFEMREWGVKSAGVYVPKQTITLNIDVFKPNSEDVKQIDIELNLDHVETDSTDYIPLSPTSLTLDGDTWVLSFFEVI